MNVRMDMCGWIEDCVDGRVDRWMCGLIDGCVDRWIDPWMDMRMCGWLIG